jgi:LytR cell envelope-related transcriptional attenuator
VSAGRQAPGEGSLRRSSGIHVARALALVAVAIVIGAVLLRRNGNSVAISAESSTTLSTSTATTTATTAAPATTTIPALRAPSAVKVLVANGTSIPGQAALQGNKLHGAGYDTLASTNTLAKVQGSVAYYGPGFQPEAVAIARLLGVPVGAVKALPAAGQLPVANLQGANILVVVGPDLVATAASGTTTTRPATTTTTRPATTPTTVKH